MKKDIVIAGGGRIGLRTAEILYDRGHDVTVIESDPERVDAVSGEYLATVFEGDATDASILKQAGVDDADAIAALTDDARANLVVCMEAKELSPGIQTLTRTDVTHDNESTRAVDATILPPQVSADQAADLLTGGAVRTLVGGGELDILLVAVGGGAPVAGHTLAEVRLPEGSLVVSDASGEHLARPETELEPGESYIVAVEADVADEVMNLFRG